MCNCCSGLASFNLSIQRIIEHTSEFALMDASIWAPTTILHDKVRNDCNCGDKHQHVQLKIPSFVWEAISGKSAGLSVANMIGSIQGMQVTLDGCHAHAIVIPDEVGRLSIPGKINIDELCARGFAGWIHASHICCCLGIDMYPVFAVEYDQQIVMTYHTTWCDSHWVSNFSDFYHGKICG